MFEKEGNRLLSAAGLGHDRHVRARIDDGGDTHAHEWMIIHNHYFDLLDVAHRHACALPSAIGDPLRGTCRVSSVPTPAWLFSASVPPMRFTRSRMPTNP